MRSSFILLLLCFNFTLSGSIYYVSPTGNDGAAGTITSPWKSLNYAYNRLVAGDILYVGGGTYTIMGSSNKGIFVNRHNGTLSRPISVVAYPGEFPILDCSSLSASSGDVIGLEMNNCSYWTIKGLDIRNVPEPTSHDGPGPGCSISDCSNITFEQVNVHDCFNGFITYRGDYIYYINCDSFQNADVKDGGDLANGFYTLVVNGGHVFYEGCRAWLNSDDGWDGFNAVGGGDGYITYNNCWAFENGAWNGITGNGCGFKTGVTTKPAIASIQRTLTNCLAFNNTGAGFDESQDPGIGYSIGHAIYNCVSYNNPVGFTYSWDKGQSSSLVIDILKNNISYKDRYIYFVNLGGNTADHNSWNVTTMNDNQFANITNPEQAKGPRQADGSLPNMSFLHIAPGSPLVDAGVDVGLPFAGDGPDIGAFETGLESTVSTPVYISSVIEHETPSLLEMTYNIPLANIVPVSSSFSVLVNSIARTVNSVTVSGSNVQLTLANRIIAGDFVTVSYSIPSNNPLQTIAGGTVASHVDQPVINNCINIAPEAAITSPDNNSSFTAPASITISANASDSDGSVSMVEFYNGSIKLGTNSIAPYSFTWTNVTGGIYSLRVIAIDNLNKKTISPEISVTVIDNSITENIPPVVTITNPPNGKKFARLSTITIDAIASDADGTVSKVEFYNGEVKLVELTSSPYTYKWIDVAAGSYSITAVATDNFNSTATSLPVKFEVTNTAKYDPDSEIIILYPNPNNGHFSVEFLKPLQNDKSVIIITDTAGKQVYNGLVFKEEILKQFDLSGSDPGIYLFMIMGNEVLYSKQFIKFN